MTSRAKSNIVDLLPKFKAVLITANVFNDSTANLSLNTDRLEFPPGDIYVLITPQRFNSYEGSTDGGGIESMILVGRICFTIWFLNAIDEPSRDTTVLTDATLGVYGKVDDVISALQLWDGCNGHGYLAEPMRLTEMTQPIRSKDHNEWVSIQLFFETKIWNLV
jgi:hypothetical protein